MGERHRAIDVGWVGGAAVSCIVHLRVMRRSLAAQLLLGCLTTTAHAQADIDAERPALEVAPSGGKALDDELTRDDTRVSHEELDKLLARYAHEPSAVEVVAAALRAQRRDPRRYADMTSRARLRGLLPNLDVGVRRGQGVDLRSTTTDELGAHLTTADDLMLFATLRFELGRLLFAGEEVTIAREERFARHAQNEMVRQVVHLYFLRRRLFLERDLRGDTSLSRAVQIEEIEALLDVFTDGSWKRMMNRAHAANAP
jgi:hypothetical protein